MNKQDLIKTAHGYMYRGVAITKAKDGFSFGWSADKCHGRSYPDTLKKTVEKIDEQLANLDNSVERCRIIRKG